MISKIGSQIKTTSKYLKNVLSGNLFIEPKINKLERLVNEDFFQKTQSHNESSKLAVYLKKLTDLILKTTDKKLLNSEESLSDIVKLIKINEKIEPANKTKNVEMLINKAKSILESDRFIITPENFDDLTFIQTKVLQIMKLKETPQDTIENHIKNLSKNLHEKISATYHSYNKSINYNPDIIDNPYQTNRYGHYRRPIVRNTDSFEITSNESVKKELTQKAREYINNLREQYIKDLETLYEGKVIDFQKRKNILLQKKNH